MGLASMLTTVISQKLTAIIRNSDLLTTSKPEPLFCYSDLDVALLGLWTLPSCGWRIQKARGTAEAKINYFITMRFWGILFYGQTKVYRAWGFKTLVV